VANATVAFVEFVQENHQLSSKVGGALAKLLRTRLDGDDLFKHCKGLQAKKLNLGGKVESMVTKKDELAKRIVKFEA